jgi:diguanylate cyclase (GGDEF)-like protein
MTTFRRWPPGNEDSAHALFPLQGERALLAGGHRLARVDADGVRDLNEELVYPRLFVASTRVAGRVYVGTEHGLRVADVARDPIAVTSADREGDAVRVNSVFERDASDVFVGTDRDGVIRYQLGPVGEVLSRTRFAGESGLALGEIAQTHVAPAADGALMVATPRGFFRFDGTHFVADDNDGLGALREDDETLVVLRDRQHGDWAYSAKRVLQRPPGQPWRELPLASTFRSVILDHVLDADGRLTLVGMKSLLQYRAAASNTEQAPPQVALRAVVLQQANGERRHLPLRSAETLRFPEGDFALGFQFALPDLEQERAALYQGRLQGYEAAFSDWTRSRGYQYSRLRPGDYVFSVRARDARGRVSEIEPFRFSIDARWYRSTLALLLWTALALALVVLLVAAIFRRRTRNMRTRQRDLQTMVDNRTRDLAAANRRLELMANMDGLTGLPNRRRLDEYLALTWQHSHERQRPLAVIAIDIDHFKRYNDEHGHLRGDELLRHATRLLAQCLRRTEDVLARYGGEEFVVVMPGANASQAAEQAEAMLACIADASLGVTISLGVASEIADGSEPVETLVERADQALYAAKSGGRNRVVVADPR